MARRLPKQRIPTCWQRNIPSPAPETIRWRLLQNQAPPPQRLTMCIAMLRHRNRPHIREEGSLWWALWEIQTGAWRSVWARRVSNRPWSSGNGTIMTPVLNMWWTILMSVTNVISGQRWQGWRMMRTMAIIS